MKYQTQYGKYVEKSSEDTRGGSESDSASSESRASSLRHQQMASECCQPPKLKMKCAPTKECVKTYKCCYKLYRFTQYRLYQVCDCCGHEFDHYHHNGICPKCK